MRIKLLLEYDGTEYCGWQIQPNGVTVQQRLQEAVSAVTGEEVSVVASGRTDSGVHAAGQAAHFDTSSSIPPERFAAALNSALPSDIRVLSSEAAPEGFHARFSAKKKTYCYKMYVAETLRPLYDRYACRLSFYPDVTAMKRAARLFEGEHDFRAFMASGSEVKDTVRTVYSSEIICDGDFILFTVCGNGFLYNMVRIMAGTLAEAGAGKMTDADIIDALENGNRTLCGKTMPPHGLTLLSVEYDV
ncbi:MAG: tRNA pseudouridine(38-40) synthase TruA [Clostridia bacterium]|nr:tRNA pseudouridine(38-40) synthase TruA [Clostridia bacterium]